MHARAARETTCPLQDGRYRLQDALNWVAIQSTAVYGGPAGLPVDGHRGLVYMNRADALRSSDLRFYSLLNRTRSAEYGMKINEEAKQSSCKRAK